MADTFKISEIVGPTIQGEGMHSGCPCVLVRFSGCNLWPNEKSHSIRCPFCDTPQLHNKVDMTAEEIFAAIEAVLPKAPHGQYGIVLTGGEPLLQLTDSFMWDLTERFEECWVDVETNGSIEGDWGFLRYDPSISISCSPKTVGICIEPDWFKILVPNMEYLLGQVRKDFPRTPIYLQPIVPLDKKRMSLRAFEEATAANVKRCVELCLEHGYKMSVQLHKVLDLP